MDNIFEKFDSMFDIDAMNEEFKDAADRNTERVEVPDGQYECKIEKMELRESKSGNPMVSIWFRIVAGDFKNSVLFMHQTINRSFGLHKVKTMLHAMDTGLEIVFHSFGELAALLEDQMKAIDEQGLEYAINYTTAKNDFKNFEITDVFRPNN